MRTGSRSGRPVVFEAGAGTTNTGTGARGARCETRPPVVSRHRYDGVTPARGTTIAGDGRLRAGRSSPSRHDAQIHTAAEIQRRGCGGTGQLVKAGRIPFPAMPGKPGKVRLSRFFCRCDAVKVNEPRKERVCVVIEACQTPPEPAKPSTRAATGAWTAWRCNLQVLQRPRPPPQRGCADRQSQPGRHRDRYRSVRCFPAKEGAERRLRAASRLGSVAHAPGFRSPGMCDCVGSMGRACNCKTKCLTVAIWLTRSRSGPMTRPSTLSRC
jgi:hypothetical protein